jgi:hypothetical protein
MAKTPKAKNPLLEQVIQAITAKVAPDQQKAFNRIVVAGMKLMYADKTEAMLRKQMDSAEPPIAAGQGAAKLVGLLLAKSKGTAPFKAMIPAGVVLTCEALDFMEKAGKAQLTPDLVSEAVQEFGSAVLQVIGVTPEKLDQMMARIPDAQKPQEPAQEQPPEQPQQPPQQPQPAGPQPLIGAVA